MDEKTLDQNTNTGVIIAPPAPTNNAGNGGAGGSGLSLILQNIWFT